ncbi:unnamed protein product [Acanthosepion pharaonis]|uniref:Reverse transcriptase domain-containing protein n=1 Tax=Acanthosepion pharaonis TaxID=158019 RepID=A0A812ARD4_ACAPH|nr:unnamed protein product [Sepia pharaonis]
MSDCNRRLFAAARNDCKRVLNDAKSLFAARMKERIASRKFGSKDYWRLCKSVLNKCKPSIPPLFNQFEVLTSSTDKAECFARKFSSNSTLDSSGVPIPDFPLRTEAILSGLNITPTLSPSLFGKIFEALINTGVVNHLTSNNLLSDKQYGFRFARSTADVLTAITETVYRTLQNNGEARAVALDISKAFDRVWHAGLLRKIQGYGITGQLYNVIQSFLSNRELKVVHNGFSSSSYPTNAGVPQGSILGPTLFLIYINDLPDAVTSQVGIYADDTTIYSCLKNKSSLADKTHLAVRLEKDLQSIVNWGKIWLVNFNASKTKLLSINHHREPSLPSIIMSDAQLPESNSLRLLGLTLTADLRWNKYIESIASSTSRKVGSLSRARKFFSPESILQIYKSTIRPCMEYCCHIWSGAPSVCLGVLDRLQRRICNMVGPTLASRLQSLSHRRTVASLSVCSTNTFMEIAPRNCIRWFPNFMSSSALRGWHPALTPSLSKLINVAVSTTLIASCLALLACGTLFPSPVSLRVIISSYSSVMSIDISSCLNLSTTLILSSITPI